MKYRPSKPFLFTVLPLAVLVITLGFGILPRLEKLEIRPIPGEIIFRSEKLEARHTTIPRLKAGSSTSPMAWIDKKYESFMTWKRNPWRRPPSEFGDHYFTLRTSKDPRDQAKSRELQRRSEASFQRLLLLRYPELAITMKSIPNEQNGFLKWLDLSDKVKAASSESVPKITFPKAIDDFLYQRAAWKNS